MADNKQSFQAGQAAGRAEEKTNVLVDKIKVAATSAGASAQTAGQKITEAAGGAVNLVKEKTGMKNSRKKNSRFIYFILHSRVESHPPPDHCIISVAAVQNAPATLLGKIPRMATVSVGRYRLFAAALGECLDAGRVGGSVFPFRYYSLVSITTTSQI
ncbi:Uncharacterized protein Rs2_06749 [Raphanus sativus]|nr:Uncharacterized protein Rs2_06749 [Raphanus sativus]